MGHKDIRDRRAYRAREKANHNLWYQRHPEKTRVAKLRLRYGVTQEWFNDTLIAQGNKCAICLESFSSDQKATKPNVDHDHETGKARGLLCQGCNQGIGSFKEDPKTLASAISYLEVHSNVIV